MQRRSRAEAPTSHRTSPCPNPRGGCWPACRVEETLRVDALHGTMFTTNLRPNRVCFLTKGGNANGRE